MKDTDVICFCRSVTYGTVVESIKNGAATIDDVVARTSAGSVCGACKTRILSAIKEVNNK